MPPIDLIQNIIFRLQYCERAGSYQVRRHLKGCLVDIRCCTLVWSLSGPLAPTFREHKLKCFLFHGGICRLCCTLVDVNQFKCHVILSTFPCCHGSAAADLVPPVPLRTHRCWVPLCGEALCGAALSAVLGRGRRRRRW